MSWEVIGDTHSLGQFASNRGYADLIEAAEGVSVLEHFFAEGETDRVPEVAAALRTLEGAEDVKETAKALADLMEGQKSVLISDGMLEDDEVEKDDDWPHWIGVDLDRTLAIWDGKDYDLLKIGAPIPDMVARVKGWLAEGKTVKILTARLADDPDGKVAAAIRTWTKEHIGQELEVTNAKDPGMTEYWGDEAHGVVANTGIEKEEDEGETVIKAGNGIMIAFFPDSNQATKLALPDGEKPEDLHLTLAYLGKMAEVDVAMLPLLETTIQDFARQHMPVTGDLGGPGRFNATEHSDNKDVAIATFESKDIQKFRQELVEALEKAGFSPRKNFGYTPHVTLQYIDPGADLPVQRIGPIPVVFSSIALCISGERKEFALAAYENNRDFEVTGNIVKLDQERQMVFGWFSIVKVGDRLVTDTQKDIITPEVLEESAYHFVLYARKAGEMHETDKVESVIGVGRLIESIVFTQEKQEAIVRSLREQGIAAAMDLGCVGWWGGMKIDDRDTWAKVTEGKLRAWSIGGKGKREKLED